jgi:hypothetical protein
MLQSDKIDLIAAALVSAQKAMKPAILNKTNPHFRNKYADLPTVIETSKVLQDHGIAVVQTPQRRDGAFCLVTQLIHSSGQWIAGEYPLPAQAKPQELGSAMTYARRYSLSSIACIAADEDDDAEGARKTGQVAEMPKRENPHVTQPRDVNEYEERVDPATGEILDCIPVHLHRAPKLKVADARPVAETLLHAMRACKTAAELVTWAEEHAEQFAGLPDKWISMYQGEYQALLDNLRKQKAA